MPYRQDLTTGEWIEVDASGNPVGTPSTGTQVFALPEGPAKVAERQQQAAKDAAIADDRTRDNERADRALAVKENAAALTAELARLKIDAAKLGGAGGSLKKVQQLVAQINRVQQLYDENIGATSGLAGLRDYLPTNENARFDTAGAQLSQIGLAAFRTPGTGTVSDRDAIMFDKGNLPTASTRDAAIEEILGGLRRRVEEEYEAAGQPAPVWGTPAETETKDAPPLVAPPAGPSVWDGGGNGPGAPPMVGASGANRNERNDRLSAQVDAMINAGADEATINTVLKQQGYGALPLGSIAAARNWMKQNPGKKYYGANAERQVPLSMMERAAGSPLGAFAANWADSATAGTVGALAGDQGKGALDAMDAMHPTASTLGSIGGGVVGAGAAEAALAARAPLALARYAPRMADALYGGVSGFNGAEEGQGAEGALTGGLTGLAGGFAGERLMRGAGAVARGVSDPVVDRLRNAGVPLTVGQVLGRAGPMGNAVNKLEQAASSIPIVGSQIGARFDDGIRGVNRAAFEVGAETTGGQVQDIGSQGLSQLRGLVQRQYGDALDPVRIDLAGDTNALEDIAGALDRARGIPQVGENAAGALEYRIAGGSTPDGGMQGRDFQEAYRGLARDGRSAATGPYANEFAGVMREGQDALAGALERQNPGAFEGFQAANTANRRAMVLADAVNAAKNQTDEMFTPAQLNAADANSATRLTGRLNSASGNRPFAELAGDAQAVMGNRLPNSGTADRALATLALGGIGGAGAGYAAGDTGTGTGIGLGTMLALLAGGSRAGQQALTGAIINRPAILRQIGRATGAQSRLGGALGTALGVQGAPLVVGP